MKIRDVLALGTPTGADDDLAGLFTDQIVTLGQIVRDLKVHGEEVRDPYTFFICFLFSFFSQGVPKCEWVKFRTGETGRRVIAVNLPQKYVVS